VNDVKIRKNVDQTDHNGNHVGEKNVIIQRLKGIDFPTSSIEQACSGVDDRHQKGFFSFPNFELKVMYCIQNELKLLFFE